MNPSQESKHYKKQTSLQTARHVMTTMQRHQSAQLEQNPRLSMTSQSVAKDARGWFEDEQTTQATTYELKFERQQSIQFTEEATDYVYPQLHYNPYYYMIQSQQIVPQYTEDMFIDAKQRSQTMKTDEAKFKTELCKNWEETGRCNYGRKCQFAHGREELMLNPTVVTNNKYKSKSCNQYHQQEVQIPFNQIQYCSYGSRCLFIHERRSIGQIKELNLYQKYLATISVGNDQFFSEFGFKPRRLDVFLNLTRSRVWETRIGLLILETQDENKSSDEY